MPVKCKKWFEGRACVGRDTHAKVNLPARSSDLPSVPLPSLPCSGCPNAKQPPAASATTLKSRPAAAHTAAAPEGSAIFLTPGAQIESRIAAGSQCVTHVRGNEHRATKLERRTEAPRLSKLAKIGG